MDFLDTFSKNIEISNVMKIRPVWEPSCSMRTDGQTDMTKLIVTFRYFVEAPKKALLSSVGTRTVSAAWCVCLRSR